MAMSLETQRALANALGQPAANEIITAFNAVAGLSSIPVLTINEPGDGPSDADALRDDLAQNVIPDIATNLDTLRDAINTIRTGFGGS